MNPFIKKELIIRTGENIFSITNGKKLMFVEFLKVCKLG